jgi:glycosyltransferase involved in cell wall biosynthesis
MPRLTALAQRAFDLYRNEGFRTSARVSIRYILLAMLEKVSDRQLSRSKHNGSRHKSTKFSTGIDLSVYTEFLNEPSDEPYDVISATDLRLLGGNGASTAQELEIHAAAGLRCGAYHLPRQVTIHRTTFEPAIDAVLRTNKVDLINIVDRPVRARILLFRHPTILNPGGDPLPEVDADEVLLIVNHTPIKFGRIEYLLPHAIRQLREAYGVTPRVYPIGPLIRSAIETVYDGTIKLEPTDWVNVFDIARFKTERAAPENSILRIGRHSRRDPEKWPSDPDEIRAAYPNRSGIEVHILGGADTPETLLGKLPSNWTVHNFGTKDVVEFLREIDVFVYFHHPDWVEAFGRVIVEAMAAGLPVILPPHFEPLLGDTALYCEPEGVADILEQLRDPTFYMLRSKASRDTAVRRFSTQVHIDRLRALGAPQAKAE